MTRPDPRIDPPPAVRQRAGHRSITDTTALDRDKLDYYSQLWNET